MSDHMREVLTAHKSDINRVLDHRRTLLEQLYATSLSFLEFKAPGLHHNDLSSFLDANDISRGRSFDVSTLPGADILGHGGADRQQAQTSQDNDSGNLHTPSAPYHAPAKDPASQVATREPPAKSTRSLARGSKSQEEAETTTVSSFQSDRQSGRPSEVGVSPQFAVVEASEAAKRELKSFADGPGASQENEVDVERDNPSLKRGQGQENASSKTYRTIPSPLKHDLQDPAFPKQQRDTGNDGIQVKKGSYAAYEDSNTAGNGTKRPREGNTEIQEQQDARGGQYRTYGSTAGDDEDIKSSAELPSRYLHGSLDAGSPMVDVVGFQPEADGNRVEFTGNTKDIEPKRSLQRTPGLRGHITGLNGESSEDPTISRRPPMRIDTKIPSASDSNHVSAVKSSTTNANNSQAATPSKQPQPTPSAQSPPERMTTRYSSGAIRHKSVSELMGETPRVVASQNEKANSEAHQDESAIAQTPRSATSFISPDPAAFKLRLSEREREKSNKVSTVVFTKQQASNLSRPSEMVQTQQVDVKETPIKDRDYLLTLLVAQVYTPTPTHRVDRQPLNALIKSAHKALNTSDLYTDFRERQDSRILSKVHYLQDNNKWSLRQPERSVEPDRPATHWDVLLGQLKWMRTDFREEGKWKAAAAKHLAHACAQWVGASQERRRLLQVKTRPLVTQQRSRSASDSQVPVTPDLINNSTEDDGSELMEDDYTPSMQGDPPAAIFSLPPDMFVFGLNKSPISDKILEELPLFQPSSDVQDGALHATGFLPDASWKTPVVPVSKYAYGKIVRQEEEPTSKRSRHEYPEDDQVEYLDKPLSPENEEVALFNPEHKHIRDRIHAGHAFRPPSEHIMPSQSFFESRQPSQWTMSEDDELRRLVREYAYNWSLISSCLASPSTFSSGAERRTPWECFERWVTLEGLPTEMSKVGYFRAYHARLQAAARTYEAQQQLLMQQNPNHPSHLSRRRSTQPYTVDRRKNNKHMHLIDAMRKLAKKRETKILKDQHTASTAALRKANEPQKPRQQPHTPREFSRIKHERQVQREEQLKAARLQYLQQQKAMAASRAGQQSNSQMNGGQGARGVVQNVPNGASPNLTSAIPQLRAGINDPTRSGPQMPRLMNGQTNGTLPNGSQGVPHAPMQPHLPMPMGQRMQTQIGADNMRVYQEATRVQAEQQAQLQRQRQQQHSQYTSQVGSPNAQNINSMSQSHPNMLASMDGRSSPAANGSQQAPGTSGSPRLNQPQALSSGMTPAVNQIQSQIKLRNPQASPEQVSRATTEQLFRMSQAAMQAATGNAAAAAVGSNGGMSGLGTMANGNAQPVLNPQQYAHMMREQQRSQQRGGSVGSANMNGSRSVTPLNQRSGSAQSGRGLSQSPRAGQVGVAGGQ